MRRFGKLPHLAHACAKYRKSRANCSLRTPIPMGMRSLGLWFWSVYTSPTRCAGIFWRGSYTDSWGAIAFSIHITRQGRTRQLGMEPPRQPPVVGASVEWRFVECRPIDLMTSDVGQWLCWAGCWHQSMRARRSPASEVVLCFSSLRHKRIS